MSKLKKIELLKIDLFPKETVNEKVFETQKKFYIDNYKTKGFFGGKNPEEALRNWNKAYPTYKIWANTQRELNAEGQQNVVNKVNEVVEAFNKYANLK